MSKNVKRGTKRTCGSCGDRFYDLNRDPIICPKCETEFRMVLPAVEPEPEETEQVEAEKVPEGTEVVSLDEIEKNQDEAVPGDEIDNLDDISDESPELAANDDTFLEEEEDPTTDVNVIIGTPIEPKDES